MSLATQISTARHIARVAEQKIRANTGLRISLLLFPNDTARKRPEHMLRLVANALNIGYEHFTRKTRKRETVELRFIGALLLRRFYPDVTLKQIGALFGGQDHTSVINGISRAYNLLETNDIVFCTKYNKALNTVNLWLKEQ